MTDKAELELDDDFVGEDAEDAEDADDTVEPRLEVAKTNLTKRRIIDNLLDERRLQKNLAEYDFDL